MNNVRTIIENAALNVFEKNRRFATALLRCWGAQDVDDLRRILAEHIGAMVAESDLAANCNKAEGLCAENAFEEANWYFATEIWECFFPDGRPEAEDWKRMKSAYKDFLEQR